MADEVNVLIVDDLPENLSVLGRILKNAGYRVRATLSGELALQAAAIEPPDLVLLDIMMPEMDGYAVCQRLKATQATVDVPVLFISALSEATDKVRAFAVGGVDFITKPFDDAEVLARASAHTALFRARRQLAENNAMLEKTLADLRQAQSQLVSSAKMASLGVLTAGIAHELNNPINFVFANAQSSQKLLAQLEQVFELYDRLPEQPSPENLAEIAALKARLGYEECRSGLRQLLEGIRVGADRSASIIRSLRLFSRDAAGGPTSFDLHDNIDTALLMLSNRLGKDIRLDKDYGASATIIGQPGPLNQVLVNLVGNAADAVRALPDGTERFIGITTRDAQRDQRPVVQIEVTDSGGGLSPDVLPHLFEPFFTTKPVGQGVGLGLSIAYQIVREHQGWLEAENRGGGACFRVTLPRL